ncbi:hypothetical protein ACKLNR_005076 [Fusarium oxysporum f. sp. zingiberi]
MNESIYEHGNAVQLPLSPIYRSDHGDYFGWLNKYVSNVEDVFASDTEAADKEGGYLRAKRNANDEYEKAVARFKKTQKLDPTVKFQDWINQYATDYVEACRIRDTLAGKLRHSSVKLAKEMFDDAQARLEPKQGNNMPCAVSDVDTLNERATQQADIVYRPRYYLSGYRSTAKRWRDEYYDKSSAPEQRLVSFEDLKNKTWAQLGIIEPDGDNDTDETPKMDFQVTLTYTRMGVFDVKRGLWDINNFRTLLPQLASTAPSDCHTPLYKTNKLLLAYGVNLIVKLPQIMDRDVASRLRLMPGLMDDLPLTLVNGNELHAQPQTNDAYPVLLAVWPISVRR